MLVVGRPCNELKIMKSQAWVSLKEGCRGALADDARRVSRMVRRHQRLVLVLVLFLFLNRLEAITADGQIERRLAPIFVPDKTHHTGNVIFSQQSAHRVSGSEGCTY